MENSVLADNHSLLFSRGEHQPGQRTQSLATKGKVDLTLPLHNVRAKVMRFKMYKTESVTLHKSFLSTYLNLVIMTLGNTGLSKTH